MEVLEIYRKDLEKIKDEYIFHGSPILYDNCKPKQAKCDTHNPENEKNAIYGSDDLFNSIVYSFKKMPQNNFHWSCGYDKNGNLKAVLHGITYIEDDAYGYIYCFNKKEFKKSQNITAQYYCEHEIKPIKIYKVYYKDYKDLFTVENTISL